MGGMATSWVLVAGRHMNDVGKMRGLEKNPSTEELIRSVDGVADDLAWSLKWYLEATAEKPFKNALPSTPSSIRTKLE